VPKEGCVVGLQGTFDSGSEKKLRKKEASRLVSLTGPVRRKKKLDQPESRKNAGRAGKKKNVRTGGEKAAKKSNSAVLQVGRPSSGEKFYRGGGRSEELNSP